MEISLADSVYNKLNPNDIAFVTDGPVYFDASINFFQQDFPLPYSAIQYWKQFYFIGLDQLRYRTHFSYYKVASSPYPKLATVRKYRYKKDATSELYDSLGTQK